MSRQIMISLVGEQPVPVLLPVLHDGPDNVEVLLVYSEFTKTQTERLHNLLEQQGFHVEKSSEALDAYDLRKARDMLDSILTDKCSQKQPIFNITSGTKVMALAAYSLAQERSLPFLYLQSEGRRSLIYRYRFVKGKPEIEAVNEVGEVLTIDLYLRAHLGEYRENPPKEGFEAMVHDALLNSGENLEIKTGIRPDSQPSLEIDLVVRRGNQVGIAEVKTGSRAREKKPIEQLVNATEQRLLGTYTKRFIIVDREYPENNRELAKAHKIKVIELCSAASEGCLADEDKRKLIEAVTKELGGR